MPLFHVHPGQLPGDGSRPTHHWGRGWVRRSFWERPIKRVKAGPSGVEFEWEESLRDANEKLDNAEQASPPTAEAASESAAEPGEGDDFFTIVDRLAVDVPDAAVLYAFVRLEELTRSALEPLVPSQNRRAPSLRQLVRSAAREEIVPADFVAAFDEVVTMRNLVAHAQLSVDHDQAAEYAETVQRLLFSWPEST